MARWGHPSRPSAQVAHADGRYWMYYSRGVGDTGYQLRVASSSIPTGPF